jgi:transposase
MACAYWRTVARPAQRVWPLEYGLVRFSRWAKRGVWQRLFETLAPDPDFEIALMDSTIVRAHQHAAGAQKKRETKRLDVPAAG